MNLQVIEGSEFPAGPNVVLVHLDSATDLGLPIGDSVTAEFPGIRTIE